MARIPFRVSARAALLIGRENVATSQGAVTELVKNTYDADASACAILFVRRHAAPPETLSEMAMRELRQVFAKADGCYRQNEGEPFRLIPGLASAEHAALNAALDHILDLWIIDNGHGMSDEVIDKNWMVIGTDTKEIHSRSAGGRVVTGAKGIGRFALDRLGQECELYSGEPGRATIVHWIVNWGDFEGEGKVIDDVSAVIETEQRPMAAVYDEQKIASILPKHSPTAEGEDENAGEPLRPCGQRGAIGELRRD